MFAIFNEHSVQIHKLKTFRGATGWCRRQGQKSHAYSIAECGEGYWSDRILRLWKADVSRGCLYFKRAPRDEQDQV